MVLINIGVTSPNKKVALMIEIQNLTFGYDKKEPILKEISFSGQAGKSYSILGASGSGKSTLLKIFADIIKPKSGIVLINGCTPSELRKKGKTGYVFQDFKLIPFLSVEDNIFWPIENSPLFKDDELREHSSEIIKEIGLSAAINFKPNALSGGMKARVAIARSLVTNPELLLIDEGFSALDIVWRERLFGLVIKLCRKMNTQLIFVSHDLDDAISNSDMALVLSENGDKLTEVNLSNRRHGESYENLKKTMAKNANPQYS